MPPLTPSRSREKYLPQTQEDHQVRFYERYRNMADEYDREFLKKYDEDFNTTLIFVRFASGFSEFVLTRVSGRSVLCCNLRLHHRGQLSDQT